MSTLGKTWQVSYGNASVTCKSENDTKLLARELLKKGHQVRAETSKVRTRCASSPTTKFSHGWRRARWFPGGDLRGNRFKDVTIAAVAGLLAWLIVLFLRAALG
jgi:hypothetical protein